MQETTGQSGAEDQTQQQGAEQVQEQGTQDAGAQQQSQQSSNDREDGRDYFQPFKDQQRRAEKAEARIKELEGTNNGQGQAQNNNGQQSDQRIQRAEERATRAELAANGYKTREEQDFVINAAKRLGVDPVEAAEDDIISARIEKIREGKRTKDATPAPGKGGGSQKSSKLPDFSKMSNAEFDKWERENRH